MATATALEPLPHSISGLREAAAHYQGLAMRQKDRFKAFAQKNEKRVEGILDTALVVGAAAAIGYFNGKSLTQKGTVMQVGGHDADTLAGVVLTGIALFEAGGKYNDQIYMLGAGVLAASAARNSMNKGSAAALTAGTTTTTAPAVSQAQVQAARAGVAPAGSMVG